MKFESEGKFFDGDYIFGAISNSTSVAGLLSFDPEMVNISDGMFEVLLVKFPKTMIDLNECVEAIVTQQYYDYENIVFTTAKTGAFYCVGEVDWTVDGEAVESRDINVVKNIHNAITMLL